MKILLVGAGGIGSRLVPLLLEHDITIMDGDVYEDRNIGRQIYSSDEVGQNKAEALAAKYGTRSEATMLSQCDSAKGYSMIVCCPDNHAARILALECADYHHIPCVLAGNEEKQAQAFIYLPEWKGKQADPRVRYPEMLRSAEAELANSCTATIKTAEQSALANSFAASFAATLIKYWGDIFTDGSEEDWEVAEKWGPIEMGWNYTTTSVLKAGGLL